jgi:uncharacterized membrane protein
MVLKPQDLLVLLHLAVRAGFWNYASVAQALGLSTSAIHGAVARAVRCGLIDAHTRRVRREELLEFLAHGLRYVLPIERGAVTTGMPTAHGAAPLKDRIRASAGELPPIWPDPESKQRGESWQPIHPSAVFAARRDPKLYEALALVDAIRGGRARERKFAVETLKKRLVP